MKPGDLVKFAWCPGSVGIVTKISDDFVLVRWGCGKTRWEDLGVLEVIH